jgi:chromosome segregation ATPase
MAKLSILEPLEAKEQTYEQQIKELQEKIENAKKMKDTVASERKQIEAELKKLPPILARGIKNIEEKQAELGKLQEELDILKHGWVEEAKKSKISDELIEKLTKHKVPKTSNGGNKKLSPERSKRLFLKLYQRGMILLQRYKIA